MATAHSATPLKEIILSEEPFVWLYSKGTIRDRAIEPLYYNIPEACLRDEQFYQLLSLCDAIRVGKIPKKNIQKVGKTVILKKYK